MTLFKYINTSQIILIAGLFFNVPLALGYTNPIEGGSTETVTNTWVVPSGDLYVGYTTPDNSLIMNNGDIYNTHGFIGSHAGSSNNTVLLVGLVSKVEDGSTWYNSESLYLGGRRDGTNWVDGGSGNTLTVNAHSWVFVGEADTNTHYLLSGSIAVGDASGTPEMIIANGSSVWAGGNSYLGFGTNESGSVEVRGDDSVWDVRSDHSSFSRLHVGWYGSGNKLMISDGGLVLFDSAYLGHEMGSDNNMVLVTGEGSLWGGMDVYVGNYGSGNRLTVADGGGVETFSVLIGANRGSDNNTVLVTGTRAELRTGSLWVGYRGAGNALTVSDGGKVRSGRAFVGSNLGADSNTVFVTGLGSVWTNAKALRLGDGGRENGLYIDEGGLVSVGRGLYSRNYSAVAIDDPGSQILIGENYYQDATSILRFGIATNRADAPLQVGGTAEFEAGATLQYHGAVAGGLEFGRFYTNLLVEADQLIVGGVTNAHDLGALEVVSLDSSLVNLILWEQDQDMYGLLSRKHLAESAGFIPGSQMALLSGEIDALSVQGNTATVDQINQLNRMSGAQQNQQLSQLYTQGAPTYQHQQGMQGGQKQVLAQSRGFQAGNRASASQPTGAAGPHEVDQGLRGWMRGYGSWAERDESSSFSDFSQNVYGTVVGLDRTFGPVLLGAAGGYAYSDLTQENYDSSQAKTGYGVLYGSFGSTDWFGDLNFSYGRSRIETRSGTVFGANGTSDADHYSVYLGGGKEMSFADGNYLFTPEAALGISYFDQGGYSDGLREIDAYNRWSYQSRFGASVAFPRKTASVVWKPEARVYWLHEFNTDFDQIGYSLIGGSGRYLFGVQAPVEDLLEAGVGLSATIHDRLEIVLNLDGQYSRDYEALTVGGRVVYEF